MRFLWLVVVAGCVSPTEPIRPEQFEPPLHYYVWAGHVMECADRDPGLGGFLVDQIRWYTVERFEHDNPRIDVWGLWDDGNVYLLPEAVRMYEVVTHEMKHQLLWGDWRHKHEIWGCV